MKTKRKIFTLVSLLVLASMVLAACGGGATATEAPATEMPATEMPATEMPATEAPATEAPRPKHQPKRLWLVKLTAKAHNLATRSVCSISGQV